MTDPFADDRPTDRHGEPWPPDDGPTHEQHDRDTRAPDRRTTLGKIHNAIEATRKTIESQTERQFEVAEKRDEIAKELKAATKKRKHHRRECKRHLRAARDAVRVVAKIDVRDEDAGGAEYALDAQRASAKVTVDAELRQAAEDMRLAEVYRARMPILKRRLRYWVKTLNDYATRIKFAQDEIADLRKKAKQADVDAA